MEGLPPPVAGGSVHARLVEQENGVPSVHEELGDVLPEREELQTPGIAIARIAGALDGHEGWVRPGAGRREKASGEPGGTVDEGDRLPDLLIPTGLILDGGRWEGEHAERRDGDDRNERSFEKPGRHSCSG